MNPRIQMEHLPWRVVEAPYQPRENIYWETVCTLANGYMGARGLLEEGFPAEMETYPGTYIAGVFDNFEAQYVELVNIPDFLNARVWIGGEEMAMAHGKMSDYSRTLNMKEGWLERKFTWTGKGGRKTSFAFKRFLSIANPHLGLMRVRVTPLNHSLTIKMQTILDGTVFNRRQRDWPPLTRVIPIYHLDLVASGSAGAACGWLNVRTKTTKVDIVECARLVLAGRGKAKTRVEGSKVIQEMEFHPGKNGECGFDKITAVFTTRDAKAANLRKLALLESEGASWMGFDQLLTAHREAWQCRWDNADIRIEGDAGAQQGIRFNLFQLSQANARDDSGVNLAAKLLSHTRYKGNCFWDTEIFMFPFFAFTDPHAARNLLHYRYRMLPAAKKRAADHWMKGAMYPWMSAHDGGEQCDSWEYGECEIHITADVPYAIDQYLRATGDEQFFAKYGAEIFIETARFWVQRVCWSPRRKRYTILSVKGPDEYCSITNNNMFTNYMACFNLERAEEAVAEMRKRHPKDWRKLASRIGFRGGEVAKWRDVRKRMYFNWDKKKDLLIQDDTFLDKQDDDLRKYADRKKPLVEIMPYERIMRVKLLRQTDVVLLNYLLNEKFTRHQKLVAYKFYEPMTTHDSSLSYNTHSILAAELGMKDAAYYYFNKSCRLDLDDELRTAKSGIHGASLGGTWQTVVMGFGGMRVSKDGVLSFRPLLPNNWTSLSFNVAFRGRNIAVGVTRRGPELMLVSGTPLTVLLNGKKVALS